MKRKWEIEKLKDSKQLKKTANLILKNRINNLLDYSNKYLRKQNVENLHSVRIAIRRVRYSMELFMICYDKKVFNRFYNNIQFLQDLSGAVRDVDISIINIRSFTLEKEFPTEDEITKNAISKKTALEEQFKSELLKFTLEKKLKDFVKQIS